MPEFMFLAPPPFAALALFGLLTLHLKNASRYLGSNGILQNWYWIMFVSVTTLMICTFSGSCCSFYPLVIPEKITLYEAASAPENLFIILIGTILVLPTIIGYSIVSYWTFRCRATLLRYE